MVKDKSVQHKEKARKWYGRIPGRLRPVALSHNKAAAATMLAGMVRKAELGKAGIGLLIALKLTDRARFPSILSDWEQALSSSATAKHVQQTPNCAKRVIHGSGFVFMFVFMADLSASRVQRFLASLSKREQSEPTFSLQGRQETSGPTSPIGRSHFGGFVAKDKEQTGQNMRLAAFRTRSSNPFSFCGFRRHPLPFHSY